MQKIEEFELDYAIKDFGNQISDATINNYIRNIKIFFNYCVDRKCIK